MSWLGLYEKALPKELPWTERLTKAKSLGFDFLEISVDESDERLGRLDWSLSKKRDLVHLSQDLGMPIISMCLSGHRRFPYGSQNPVLVQRARDIMDKALDFALDCGIRNIQMAGYDVYYEESTPTSRAQFQDELALAVQKAASRQIMLSIETMDHPFMSSITRFVEITQHISSPWLTVYPDVGNLTAWWNDVPTELQQNIARISAIHLKDTHPVGPKSLGQFRDLAIGQGTVNFVEIFTALQKVKYQGSFVLELWGDTTPDYEQLIRSSRKMILQAMQDGQFSYA